MFNMDAFSFVNIDAFIGNFFLITFVPVPLNVVLSCESAESVNTSPNSIARCGTVFQAFLFRKYKHDPPSPNEPNL